MTTLAASDITAYARAVMNESPEDVAGQVREASAAIVGTYSGVAAEGAALFYEGQRPQAGAPVEIAPPSIGERLAADLGYALAPLFTPEAFGSPGQTFLSRLAGAVSLHTAAGDRQTMMLTSAADPLSGGVRRFARAGACAFCAYLSTVEATVYDDTVWHTDCTCVNVPWWEDNPLPDADYMDRFADAAEKARADILADYREKRKLAPDLRLRNFHRQFPETAVNTKNIAARMRAEMGLAH
ncbi:VG15 protein [Microbacterium gilvum]|uniref:VG15 protein n=1 Tax=Microbacterium gilvum TaxID=1336204 RepID=UPI0031E95B4E